MDIIVVKVLINNSDKQEFNGTAFFINSNTLITAKHVLESALMRGFEISLSEMPNKGILAISSDLITLCDDVDIAIIKLKRDYDISPLIFTNQIKVGLQVFIYGYKNWNSEINKEPKYITGFTNNIENVFESNGYIAKGYSGSPVLINNKLCGITISRSKEENVTYIIPIIETCMSIIQKQINMNFSQNEDTISTIVDKYKFSVILSRRYINIENYQRLIASTLSKREDFVVKILKIGDYREFDIKYEIQTIFNLDRSHSIESTLPKKITKIDKKVLLIIKNFEYIKEVEKEDIAKLFRNLIDEGNHPNFYLIIFGGKRLAELVYDNGNTSLFSIANNVSLWEEQKYHLSEEIIKLTGNHPKLNELCNQINLNSIVKYKSYLQTHNLNRIIFSGYNEEKLCRYLKEEDLGVYSNIWDKHEFIRNLFWDNLLKVESDRYIWRSNFIRELGRSLLCDT